MPKKTKQATAEVAMTPIGPSQAEIARLLSDTISLMQTQVVSSLYEKHETLGLDEKTMTTVQDAVKKIGAEIRNSSTNQLLKYY